MHNYNNLDQLNELDEFLNSNILDFLFQQDVSNDNDSSEYISINRHIKDWLIFEYHWWNSLVTMWPK